MSKMILPLDGSDNTGGAAAGSDDASEGKPFVEEVSLGGEEPKTAEEVANEEAEAAAAQALLDAAEGADGKDGSDDKRTPEQIAADEEQRLADEAAAAAEEEVIQEVQIGDVVYKLDADGNAVGDNNEVVHTAAELATFEEEEEGASDFELATLSQIQPVDTEGNAIVYDNTPDGRRQYIEDVYQAGAIDKASKILEDRYERFPLMKVVNDYIIANGNLDGFNEQTFVRTPVTAESTEEDLIATIRAAKLMKGDSEAEIANIISWAKSDNKLLEHAKMSDTYLAQTEATEKKQLAEEATRVEEARIAKNQQYVSELTNTITTGKLNIGGKDLVIPTILEVKTETGTRVADREELIKYATEIGQYKMGDGSVVNATQYQIDKYVKNMNKNINDDIYEMVSLFTKQDNSQLLKSAIHNDTANTVRKRLKMKKPTSKGGASSGTKGKIKLKYPSR